MSHSSTLPIELLDIIIDELHDDLFSLRALSLVCRAFRKPCRTLIFSTISLPAPDFNARLFVTTCSKLYSLLRASPEISLLIKDLRVEDGSRAQSRHFGFSWVGVEPSFTLILEKVVNLKRFSLTGHDEALDWGNMSGPLRETLCATFRRPKLKHIVLCDIGFSSLSEFSTVFMGCEALEHMEVLLSHTKRRVFHATSEFPDTITSTRAQLKSLRVGMSPAPAHGFIDLLLSPHSPFDIDHLRSLSAASRERFDHSGIEHLLNRTTSSLKHLEFDLQFGRPLEASPLPISHLTSVRFFLDIDDLFGTSHPRELLEWWTKMFTDIRDPCSLERVTVELEVTSDMHVRALDWKLLDDALTRPQMSALEAFSLEWVGRTEITDMAAIAEEEFPALYARGLLRVEEIG